MPLGDAVDRRRLLTTLVTTAAAVLAVIPWADSPLLVWLFFLLGLVSVAAMVMCRRPRAGRRPSGAGRWSAPS
ncbi:hypothetical protein [Streptomyces sp. AcE210]|uniref:hypothetical protein n=1 Tax=Streptomyces sp. AcE210 TaxID=2292703 RepID=UPI000E307D5A|nr:hypothetical protein [Streptomyces sp. AcE210]RFC77288.1 hypothetical protein DXZ75_04630 [Streptomyces sp. AcE210]